MGKENFFKAYCFLWILCLMSGCNVRHRTSTENEAPVAANVRQTANSPASIPNEMDTTRYALGYQVTPCDGYTKLEVHDPWNKGKLRQRYLLVARDKPLPDGMPAGTVVRVPLRKVVVYAAVYAAMLDKLGVANDILGVCEGQYIRTPAIAAGIEQGQIQDFGKVMSPDVERMIASGVEVIIASPLENGSFGAISKTDIPIIECTDYMETDPLGRAEWIKILGLLTGTTDRADSLFQETELNYHRLKTLAANVTNRPKLMTELKYGNTWYVSAGESFMAHIFKDAGADYIFSYLSGTGGIPLSFETVLNKAIHADIWLLSYNRDIAMTYQALHADHSSYERFDPFRNRRIYGCNTHLSLYYEEVPFRPDYLLEELIAIFHPDLIFEHDFRYYHPLKE